MPATKRAAKRTTKAQAERPTRTVMRRIPSVGRIVHYFDTKGDLAPEAAIIIEGTSQWNGDVTLLVLGVNGNYRTQASFAERPQEGTWSWPEQQADYPQSVELTDEEIAAQEGTV